MSESRVLAVLFADVVDSTRLLIELGDQFLELSAQLADRLASVPFTRGRLALCMGEQDRGIELLRRALEIEERIEAVALARRTTAELERAT